MQPPIPKKQLIAYLLIFVAAPIITFIFGSWIDNKLRIPTFPSFPMNLFTGISIIIIGLNLGIKSTKQLYQHGKGLPWGEAAHEVETQKLVTTGTYAYTRNPMVLGYSLLPVGTGVMFQSIGMVIALAPAVLAMNYIIVKRREEPRLLERFGEEYVKYREKTPFLFPEWRKLIAEYLIPYIKNHRIQLQYIFLAELSLFITALTIYRNLPLINISTNNQISDNLFVSICLLGIITWLAPKYCSFNSWIKRHKTKESEQQLNYSSLDGRIISFSGKILFADCTGLVIGTIIALIGFTTSSNPFNLEVGLWIGAMLVFLGLAQHLIDLGSSRVNFLLNIGFALGVWLMYKTIQTMNLNISVHIYFLVITIFWIFAKTKARNWI